MKNFYCIFLFYLHVAVISIAQPVTAQREKNNLDYFIQFMLLPAARC